MSNVKLPKKFEPFKCAQKRSSYEGVYLSQEMLRLNDSVDAVDADLAVKVEFKKDAQGLTYFDGYISANVQLTCQRCNGALQQAIRADFCFSPVQGSESEHPLPDAYDPVEVNEHGEIDLFQLLEDELILSLPIVAMHDIDDCAIKSKDLQFGKLEKEQERKNPFEVLKELKRD